MAAISNLPPQLTSFIGREREISTISDLLTGNRLVTMIGTGGAGKTRLAVEVAARLAAQRYDAVWFTNLEAITDERLVPEAVISAVGARDELGPMRTPDETLVEYLNDTNALLVLDNCEHLIDASARLTDRLLRACANLHILATSRQPLGVAGERLWPVPTLSAPESDHVPLDSIGSYEAVQLFVERARQGRPGFSLTPDNGPALVRLCRQLDGLPLAIELAASRVRVLSVQQIVDRLGERFRLLTSDNQVVLPRQQTLTALMDWSYELLSDAEQALLRSLSVFAGGFDLDGAVAVSGPGADEFAVIDLLARLVDRSLVIMKESDGRARYRMLETIRQYAYAKLQGAGEVEAARGRHRDWAMSLLEAAQPHLVGSEQAEWLDRVELEHDNLRTALDWSIRSEKNAGKALKMGALLWRFWDTRGYLTEGRRWLAEALEVPGPVDPLTRARALSATGNLAIGQGDYASAAALHSEALNLRRQAGDTRAIAASLSNLGVAARSMGEYDRALQLYEEALALLREAGSDSTASALLGNMGFVAQHQRDYARAEALYLEALEVNRRSADIQGQAIAYNNLGEVAQQRGDYKRARDFYYQGLVASEEVGDRPGRVGVMNNLASLAYLEGDREQAVKLYRETLEESRELGYIPGVAECLEGLAIEEAGVNDERAGLLFGAAMSLREKIGAPIAPYEEDEYNAHLDRVRTGLGDRFDAVLAAGKSISMDRAITLAMEVTASPQPAAPPAGNNTAAGAAKERDTNPWGLTSREIDVLRLVARGYTDPQVARELSISDRTVNSHNLRIYAKMGVATRAAATRLAMEHGLVTPDT